MGVVAAIVAGCLGIGASSAMANHSWGGYHWAHSSNPFGLRLGDDLSGVWDNYLPGYGITNSDSVTGDWSRVAADSSWFDATPPTESPIANPLRALVVPGTTTGRKCRGTTNQIEVCNASYGRNGWLGLASIWLSGSHIVQGTVKVNDTYMGSAPYNTDTWRRSVLCQEVGHTFGLDHQDESGADLDTCMDYSTSPNIHPDQHDYNELGTIYSHFEATSGGSVTPVSSGRGLHRVREGVYVEDLAGGGKRVVWVFWKDKGNHFGNPSEE